MPRRTVEVDERWRNRALCRGMNTELFFPAIGEGEIRPEVRQQIRKVMAVCAECPVKLECYAYARHFDARCGIWGGVLLGKRGNPVKHGVAS